MAYKARNDLNTTPDTWPLTRQPPDDELLFSPEVMTGFY